MWRELCVETAVARTMEDLTSTRISEELLKAVSGDDCIAWIGSGLSALAYPDWTTAIVALCTACHVQPFGVADAPSASQLIDKAQQCKAADLAAYEATLGILYGGNVVETRLAYSWLMRAPFKGYVTTNFDPLLSEAAATFGYTSIFRYPLLETREVDRRKKPIFYVHGHARPNGVPCGHDLVLARSEFDQAYNGVVSVFLQSVLLSYPIVFIGCRLSEPEIREQMRRVHSMHVQIKESQAAYKTPRRFALLPSIFDRNARDAAAEREEANLFAEMDTEVLRYNPADPAKHWEIEDILKTLCGLTSRVTEGGPGEVGPK
jgi:SIR2-like protein